jgi:two-component system chemotaxis response regulator CheY
MLGSPVIARAEGCCMAERTINLRDLSILIADPSPYLRTILLRMLRGFGASKMIEAENAEAVFQALGKNRIDVLLCDGALPSDGGFALTRKIRREPGNEHRTTPILLMTSDPREAIVKEGRDAGANMVVAKPLSPGNLYDRLAWVALNPRQYVDTDSYFGPDRRFKNMGAPGGIGRRRSDAIESVKKTGRAPAQDKIDRVFNATSNGRK